MDGEGVGGFKAMGDGIFLSCPTNNPPVIDDKMERTEQGCYGNLS